MGESADSSPILVLTLFCRPFGIGLTGGSGGLLTTTTISVGRIRPIAVWGSVALFLALCVGIGAVLPTRASATQLSSPGVHEGVASCAGSTCHGRQAPDGAVVRQNELVSWQDPTGPGGSHSRAWRILTYARAQAITRRLGLGPAQNAPACLGCHAEQAAARGARFQVSDGVGCESCHGPSGGWIASHYTVGVSHADNVARGMRPLEDPVVRANVCLDCHWGSDKPNQFVTHEMMSAGHPRLSFELELFTAFQQGDASNLEGLKDHSFDLTMSIFGAMFAPKPFDVAKEMVRVTKPGGTIVMGNWIPGDPTLVAQILKISAAYTPPPPEGFISPITWGIPANVIERFGAAGVPPANIFCVKDSYTFNFDGPAPAFLDTFRCYYGPTMNAFDAAAQAGRADALLAELAALFDAQNTSTDKSCTSIPATFLRVTIQRP